MIKHASVNDMYPISVFGHFAPNVSFSRSIYRESNFHTCVQLSCAHEWCVPSNSIKYVFEGVMGFRENTFHRPWDVRLTCLFSSFMIQRYQFYSVSMERHICSFRNVPFLPIGTLLYLILAWLQGTLRRMYTFNVMDHAEHEGDKGE